MFGPTLRCQVLEIPAVDDIDPRDEGFWPRDLLPWADPYIAALMMKLQRQRGETERLLDDDVTLEQFATEHWRIRDWNDESDGTWPDLKAKEEFPPIYGGFPLLDDE